MPSNIAHTKIARTMTVLFSTMLIGAAVPAVSQAKTSHVAHHRLHPAAGKTDPYTRSVASVG